MLRAVFGSLRVTNSFETLFDFGGEVVRANFPSALIPGWMAWMDG